ncbi:MAG: hypothetical protein U0793_14660 [Gemmataceae bacterium]
MIRKLFLAALMSLAAAVPAQAQRSEGVVTRSAAETRLSAETLPNSLKSLGYTVKVVPTEIGDPLCVVSFDKDGWEFKIEVRAQADGGVTLIAALVEVPHEKATSPKMLQILEANAVLGACSFFYRASDNEICMRTQVADAAGLSQGFAVLTEKIRLTHSIWGQGW